MYYGTFVNNEARKEMGIKPLHYMVGSLVSCLSKSRWCTMSRATMAAEIGVSKPTIISIVAKLVGLGLIQKNEQGNLRATPRWMAIVAKHEEARKAFLDGKETIPNNSKIGKESLPATGKETLLLGAQSVKKVNQIGKETLPDSGKETLPNTIIRDTIRDTHIVSGKESLPISDSGFTIEHYYKLWNVARPDSILEAHWYKLTPEEKQEIESHLPKYLSYNPTFRTTPRNYIKSKKWLEPLQDRRPQAKTVAMNNPTQIPPSSTKYRYVN